MLKKKKLGAMVHACNLSLWEAMGGFLGFAGQTVYPIWRVPGKGETASQKDMLVVPEE